MAFRFEACLCMIEFDMYTVLSQPSPVINTCLNMLHAVGIPKSTNRIMFCAEKLIRFSRTVNLIQTYWLKQHFSMNHEIRMGYAINAFFARFDYGCSVSRTSVPRAEFAMSNCIPIFLARSRMLRIPNPDFLLRSIPTPLSSISMVLAVVPI